MDNGAFQFGFSVGEECIFWASKLFFWSYGHRQGNCISRNGVRKYMYAIKQKALDWKAYVGGEYSKL